MLWYVEKGRVVTNGIRIVTQPHCGTIFAIIIQTPYYLTYPKIWTSPFYLIYLFLCLKFAEWVANSVDPDQTPRSAGSDQDLHCLLMPVCPNT